MNNTNYIGGVVKILEAAKLKAIDNKISIVTFRVQLSQFRQTRIVKLVFWGNLAREILNYYKINDYILIEGYISLRNKSNSISKIKSLKNVEITVSKVYPFLINYDHLKSKT